jgi:mannosyltransferase
MKNKPIWVGIVILISAGLRSVFINTRGMIYDDAFSIFLSQQNLTNIIRGTGADTMPPLYYFLLHFWMLAGESLWYLRLLSLIISITGILLLYLFTREVFDERSALIAAVLASISPLQIYHAQDIRMYALLQAGQLSFAWCFVRIWKAEAGQKTSGYWTGLILSGTAAMYTHNLAGFVLVAPAFFLIFKRNWALLRRLIGAYAVIGVLFLPWALQLPGQFSKIQNAFWTPKPGIVEILQVMIQFTANLPLPDIFWVGAASVLTLQIVIILVLESRHLKGKRDEQLLFAVMIFTAPILTLAVSYLVRPIFLARGFLVSSMFFYGYAGWIISKRWKSFIGTALLGCFVFSELMGLPYQLNYNLFPRSPFQEAGAYLEGEAGEGTQIIHDNKLSYFPTHYFDPTLKQVFLADTPGSSNDTLAYQTQQALSMFPEKNLQVAVGNAREVYFVVFDQTLSEYQGLNEDHPVLAWLDTHFQTQQVNHFQDLAIYHFSQRR